MKALLRKQYNHIDNTAVGVGSIFMYTAVNGIHPWWYFVTWVVVASVVSGWLGYRYDHR